MAETPASSKSASSYESLENSDSAFHRVTHYAAQPIGQYRRVLQRGHSIGFQRSDLPWAPFLPLP